MAQLWELLEIEKGLTAVMGSIYQYIHVAFQGSFACITVGLTPAFPTPPYHVPSIRTWQA